MTVQKIQDAAIILADLRLRTGGHNTPLDDLPPHCRPQTLDEAYALQDAARTLLETRGMGAAVGWKIGCTTPVMQEYLNIPHPCAGTLYRKTVYENHADLKAADFFQLGLECEIAVSLSTDIPARSGGHSAATVAAAVGAVMASVEIVEHRFRDFSKAGTPSLIADDFFSCGCVLGAAIPLAEAGDLAALSGGFSIDGEAPQQQGNGSAILGHPLNALAWLADHFNARGSWLKAGEIITLGSVIKTIYPQAGMHVEARFEQLAPVTLQIS
jgi:2-oxo-3-hexenedioate decarboxylase/2-keto-4-pentenoate hydratase